MAEFPETILWERVAKWIAAAGHSRCATATVEEFWSPFPLTHLARTEIVSTVYARAIRFGSKGPTSTKTASTSKPSSEIALDFFIGIPRARHSPKTRRERGHQ